MNGADTVPLLRSFCLGNCACCGWYWLETSGKQTSSKDPESLFRREENKTQQWEVGGGPGWGGGITGGRGRRGRPRSAGPRGPRGGAQAAPGPRAGASGPGAGPEPVLETGSPAQVTAVGRHVRTHVCTCACMRGARKDRLIRQEAAIGRPDSAPATPPQSVAHAALLEPTSLSSHWARSAHGPRPPTRSKLPSGEPRQGVTVLGRRWGAGSRRPVRPVPPGHARRERYARSRPVPRAARRGA